MKFIDLETGSIHFPNGAMVKKDDSIEHVARLNLGQSQELSQNNSVLYISGIPFDGEYLNITLGFGSESKLDGGSMFLSDDFPYTPPTMEVFYSWEYQEMCHEKNKAWFKKYIGEPGLYSWGKVYCNLVDRQGPQAFMGIDYEQKL